MYVCICHMGWCRGGESWVWLDHSPDMFVLFHLRHLERGPLKAAVTLSLHRSNRQETGMLWADLKPPASPFSTAQELCNAASQIEMLLKTTFHKLIFKSSIPESKIGNASHLLLSKDFALHFYFLSLYGNTNVYFSAQLCSI